MAGVAVLMAIWWMTEAIPLAATSLIPLLLLPLTGILSAADTVQSYLNSTILLYLGGFLIALAMERWNLHRRIALTIISRVGARPASLVLGFMIATAVLSMWISNTATSVMMLPIGLAIVGQIEDAFDAQQSRPLAVGLMLGIAYAASVGGCATLVGTPTNLAFASVYQATFPDAPAISFGQWFIFGLPFSITLLAIIWLAITRVFWRVDGRIRLESKAVRTQLAALGPMRREETCIVAVFASAALLWIFRQDLELGIFTVKGWSSLASWLQRADDGTVAIGLALVLFLIPGGHGESRGRLLEADVFQKVPWGIILLFGGGFALAAGFKSSGLSAHLADQFGSAEHMPAWVIVGLVCLVINFLTELTSNTATAQMFLPVLAAWAIGHEVEPLYVMIPATLSASMAFMLPVATPPNAIVFSSGRLSIRDMARTGLLLNLISVVLITLWAHLFLPLVFSFPRP